ncbi:bifunctional glycoside hydrolase 114/ polysaccharide deacetylase family protein [Candidatus Nitrospira salsa]
MDRRSIHKRIRVVLCLACIVMAQAAQGWSANFSVAFFYGEHAPLDELHAFDVVVIEPDHHYDPNAYRTSQSELFAYVSLGEFASSRAYAQTVPKQWVLGKNSIWDSQIIDQSQEAWPTFVIEHIIGPLWKQGFRGFFLDTLDSYHLVASTAEEKQHQEQGLSRVIRAIKRTYPDAKLIFNRGFEIIPTVADHVFAVAAESVFRGWDQQRSRYVEVSQNDRQWLVQQLQTIQQSHDIPAIVIDYLPPQSRKDARDVARKIQDLGMIPWVSTPELNLLGIGAVEVMPRKILAVYDSARDPQPVHSDLHRFIDFPLNHLGYVSTHHDVRSPLPDYPLTGRYAGIVVWVSGDQHPWSQEFHLWVQKQIHQGIRIVFFDSFGFPLEEPYLTPLDLSVDPLGKPVTNVHFSIKDPRMGYEIDPIPKRRGFVSLTLELGESLLQVESLDGQRQDVVAITPWGGYALFPYAVIQLPNLEHSRWVFDPIRFLQDTLRLAPMPVPDTTTQNGRRLLLTHIDGDGFPSLAEFPGKRYAGEVLYRNILKKYQVPTTLSVIEGEIGAQGLYPKLTPRFEKTARAMFALKHVEMASHSYSHPLVWREFVISGPNSPGDYNLNIPDYVYGPESLTREIKGSIDYINSTLAPPDKRVQVFLWTGDCNPAAEAVDLTYEIQVGNMNGGDTIMTKQHNSLTAVAAFGIQKGKHYQIYAPNQNENIYTNEWTGPYYGFERVIETFQLTDRPRRLKPINIYYHTYSASKKASLTALHRVYSWALQQGVNPIYVSEYIQKVHNFNQIVIAKAGTSWNIRGTTSLKELRIPQTLGYPDLQKSQGIAGFSDHETHRYLHVADQSEVTLQLKPTRPTLPYLHNTNGQLLNWVQKENTLQLTLKSYQPLIVSVGNATKCAVTANVGHVENRQEGKLLNLFVTQQREKPISITCS